MAADEGQPATGSQPAAPTTGSQPAAAPPTPEQQLEGLRAWVARLDRRLGVRTVAGALVLILALAAGIVGVVLATNAKDESATKDELRALSAQVEAVGREASQAAEEDVASLSDRIDSLEARVSTIASSQRTGQSELDVAKDDIDELRNQIADLETTVNNLESAPTGGNSGN
jgi:septal ring factor EnvC (AmiA/AmiB activator)